MVEQKDPLGLYHEFHDIGMWEGFHQGIQQDQRSLVIRQLTKRVGELPQELRSLIETLSLEQLENLGEPLLDFTSMSDLQAWLES